MPIFDNINGMVPPPEGDDIYSVFNIPPIIAPPEEVVDYILEEDVIVQPPIDSSDNSVLDQEPELPSSDSIESLEQDNIIAPTGDPIDALDGTFVNSPNSDAIDPLEQNSNDLPSDTNTELPESITILVAPADENAGVVLDSSLVEFPIDINAESPELFDLELAPTNSNFLNPPSNEFSSALVEGIVYAPDEINWGNTLIDQLFTGANNIFDTLGLPFPESINNLYALTQTIEGFIDDPSLLAAQLQEVALGFLIPRLRENGLDPITGIMKAPIDSRYEILQGTFSPVEVSDFSIAGEEVAFQERKGDYKDVIEKSQFSFQGRKSVLGMTMRLNHMWDIRISPYIRFKDDKTFVPPMGVAKSEWYPINAADQARENKLDENQKKEHYVKGTVGDFEDNMPILSYDLDFKTLVSKEIELFAGGAISVPELIRQTSHMSMQVLDDENKRWRRWFQRYIESMYNEKTGFVQPYKNCCVKIHVYQYRSDLQWLSHKIFLGVLKNYQVLSSGSGSGQGNADLIDVEWSIVGELDISQNDNLNVI